MGLDQWLFKQKREQVAYFRKVNFLHGFFDEVEGLENNRTCYVSRDIMEELVSRCEKVLTLLEGDPTEPYERNVGSKRDEITGDIEDVIIEDARYSEDIIEMVMELLPPAEGFFFGSYEIDGYYKETVEHVLEVSKQILDTFDFDEHDLIYDTWW